MGHHEKSGIAPMPPMMRPDPSHCIFSLARPQESQLGATSLILALSSHGQQVSTRGALGCGGRRTSVLRVEERGRQGKSARGRNERGRHLRRTDPTMKFDLREISLPEVGQDVAVAVEFWATTAGDRIMTRRWHGSLWTRSGYSLFTVNAEKLQHSFSYIAGHIFYYLVSATLVELEVILRLLIIFRYRPEGVAEALSLLLILLRKVSGTTEKTA